ncbi:MAG: MgtC/SapB family protein [Acidimicrobiia bacterium]|nr:MgtC/SapB family protein [Acidimicrobiia bacterium]
MDWIDSAVESVAFIGGVRVAIAIGLGLVLGLERQLSNKDAGVRTYALVAGGASLFTVISIYGFSDADTSRVAAQVVTGIGFLGAGLIFREGLSIQGLTTAAGLWSVAAIGMAAGTGNWGLAIIATVIVLVMLVVTNKFSPQLRSQARRDARISVRLTVADAATIQNIRKSVTALMPSAAKPMADIGHWAVGQHKGLPTLTLKLSDEELHQLVPLFEADEAIRKIHIETNR